MSSSLPKPIPTFIVMKYIVSLHCSPVLSNRYANGYAHADIYTHGHIWDDGPTYTVP